MAQNQKENYREGSAWMEVPTQGQANDMDMVNHDDTLSSGSSYNNIAPNSYKYITPAQVDNHLEFLDFSIGEKLLLGSSNLTGRYWSGSIWYYDNPSLAPAVESCKSGLEFTAGVTEGVFLGEDSAVVGMDGGILEFISIGDNGSHLSKAVTFDEHSTAVTQVKMCSDSVSIVTATTDSCIKIYDTTRATVRLTYNPAHAVYLTSISTHPSHPDMFLSSSLDGTVLLWDTRKKEKPACCVFESEDYPTAISWVNNNSNQILVGSSSGTIKLCETIRCNEVLHSLEVFQRPIFRFMPNKFRENSLACCADETKVAVLGVNGEEIIVKFEDDIHCDYVRGLAWMTDQILFSCGWDKMVHKYDIL